MREREAGIVAREYVCVNVTGPRYIFHQRSWPVAAAAKGDPSLAVGLVQWPGKLCSFLPNLPSHKYLTNKVPPFFCQLASPTNRRKET